MAKADGEWQKARKRHTRLNSATGSKHTQAANAAASRDKQAEKVLKAMGSEVPAANTVHLLDSMMWDLRAEMTEIEEVLEAAGLSLDKLRPTMDQVEAWEAFYGPLAQKISSMLMRLLRG